MSRKIKYISYITEDKVDSLLKEEFPNLECPKCHHNSLYAGCVETEYNEKTDEKTDEKVLLSFGVFCKDCGACITKWDNTDRKYLMYRRNLC